MHTVYGKAVMLTGRVTKVEDEPIRYGNEHVAPPVPLVWVALDVKTPPEMVPATCTPAASFQTPPLPIDATS